MLTKFRYSISDKKVEVICQALGIKLSRSKIGRFRKKVDQEVNSFFRVVKVPDCIECSTYQALTIITKIEENNANEIPNMVHVKISPDGRALKNGIFSCNIIKIHLTLGQVVWAMTPINLKTFQVQSRNSVFQLLMAQGAEKKELSRKLGSSILRDLNQIQHSGIIYNQKTISVRVTINPGFFLRKS